MTGLFLLQYRMLPYPGALKMIRMERPTSAGISYRNLSEKARALEKHSV